MQGSEEAEDLPREGPHDQAPAELLQAALERLDVALDEQARTRRLLDAVVDITSYRPLDDALGRIVSVARDLVGARYAAMGVLAEGSQRGLRRFIYEGMPADQAARIGGLPAGRGLLGLLIDDPRPVRLREISTHPASAGFPENHPRMSSFLGVPIHVRDQVFGNLYLTDKDGGEGFTELDESLTVALAAAAGVAIENARLYEQTERARAWASAAGEITSFLIADATTEQALQLVADQALSVSGADMAWVATGSKPHRLHLAVVSGPPVDVEAMRDLCWERSLVGMVVRTGVATSAEDLATDPRAVDPSGLAGWPTLGPTIVVPLRTSSGVEGALALAWKPEHLGRFQEVDPGLPAKFAEQAALAIRLAKTRDYKQRLSLLEDRDRIGRDLHDLVIQRLFGVGLGLQSIAAETAGGDAMERLVRAIDDIDGTIMDIRRTIFALGSLDSETDLQTEIEDLVDRAGGTMKLRPRLRIEGPLRSTVSAEVVPDLLAVLSEALTNVSRHAHASSVEVRIVVRAGVIELSVSDDGQGMERDRLESGLRNMRSRAARHGGEMVVESEAGSGSTVIWRVPLPTGG